MKTTTKKITALLFSLIGIAPLLFIIITSIKQQQLRHIMKERLESEMLHTISMAESDAHWLKEGKEMLVNGRMFDVKSFQQSSDGKVIVSGLYDDDETALVKAVRDTQQKDNNTSGKLLAQLFQFLGSINNSLNSDIFIFSLSNNSYFPGLEQRLTSQFITILSPPPQV